jgi:hypothetical protein
MNQDNRKQVKPLYMNQRGPLECKAIIINVGMSEVSKKRYHWIQLN